MGDSFFMPVSMPGGLTVATSNPAFSREMFPGYDQVYGVPRSTAMTVQGTVVKTVVLLAILGATALWAWNAMASQQLAYGVLIGSAIGGFIVAMVTMFKPTVAPWSADLRALEGVFWASASHRMGLRNTRTPGIAMRLSL